MKLSELIKDSYVTYFSKGALEAIHFLFVLLAWQVSFNVKFLSVYEIPFFR